MAARPPADRRGTISYSEFLMYFDFDKSLFVRRAFDILDEDASGSIVSFVTGVWPVRVPPLSPCPHHSSIMRRRSWSSSWGCGTTVRGVGGCANGLSMDSHVHFGHRSPRAGTLDKNAMLLFAFDMFDLDGTGEIDALEIAKLLAEVRGVSFAFAIGMLSTLATAPRAGVRQQ